MKERTTEQRQSARWKRKEKILDDKNGQLGWCIPTSTEKQDNGKKGHGPKPFVTQLGEEQRSP
jgi:hypothetical protein